MSKYPHGLITREIFSKCLDHVDSDQTKDYNHPIISGFGESLLHPEYDKLFEMAKNRNIFLRVHTNGLVLNEEKMRVMLENNLSTIEISIHTKKSLLAYKMAFDMIQKINPNVIIYANVLTYNNNDFDVWEKEIKLSDDAMKCVKFINTHNWALNDVPYTRESSEYWQKKCLFLKHNLVVIRWDGRMYTCCVDSEGDNYVGEVSDFDKLEIKPELYKLCSRCSPAWFNSNF